MEQWAETSGNKGGERVRSSALLQRRDSYIGSFETQVHLVYSPWKIIPDQLDVVCPEKPLWVNRIDYHSAVVNSAALRRLNIPIGMRGLIKNKDGNPTGILRSDAYLYAKARIARLYPLLGIHAAVNHPNEDQRISVDAALQMMTIDAAYAGFNENRMGTISPEKNAAFTVLDEDLFKVEPSQIKNINVEETWFSGRCVYRRESNLIEAVRDDDASSLN
ncbi:MAG: amidohydrolase family protein [Desulfobacterales bacterium]|nr:amidohydrolase family protein [Desulfobacterales bacterium]